jgi:hypothetical protein
MRKLLDVIAVVSLVLSGSVAGAGVFAYLYATNPANQEKAKQFVMDQVTDALPDLIGGAMPSLPDVSGPAIPMTPGGSAGAGAAGGLPVPSPFPF